MVDKVWSEFVSDFSDGQNVPAFQYSCGKTANSETESVMFIVFIGCVIFCFVQGVLFSIKNNKMD